MCCLRNIHMRDYQESVTTGQTYRQMPDKVIPMCRYALQATQKAQSFLIITMPPTKTLSQIQISHSKGHLT